MAENMVSSEFQIEEDPEYEEEVVVEEQQDLEESFLATGHQIDILADQVFSPQD